MKYNWMVFFTRFGKSPIIVRNFDGSDTTVAQFVGGRWQPKPVIYFKKSLLLFTSLLSRRPFPFAKPNFRIAITAGDEKPDVCG